MGFSTGLTNMILHPAPARSWVRSRLGGRMVAGCKHISSTKGREDGELFKLMSNSAIRANGGKVGVGRCLVTIRVTMLHASLPTGVREQTTA